MSLRDGLRVVDSHLREAILARLEYRMELLKVTKMDAESGVDERVAAWGKCSDIFNNVVATQGLGVNVPESISTKIQRRLASSVPPRPILQLDFVSASKFMKGLHEDGTVVEGVLRCQKLSSAAVRKQSTDNSFD